MSRTGRPVTRWLPGLLALALVALGGCRPADAEARGIVRVAVAANFADAQRELAQGFEAYTGYRVRASVGSTGQLYAQIRNGAPFDVFLAADSERPRRLEREGTAVPGSRFAYAEGRLALYGPGLDSVRAGGADLRRGGYAHLAIANPKTAPYGAAAEQVLGRLGVGNAVQRRIVEGESVGQAYQFVHSGAAELGFVALSQVIHEPPRTRWVVPAELHEPLVQEAVLLRRGAANPAARAYLRFLRGPEALVAIRSGGYGTPP